MVDRWTQEKLEHIDRKLDRMIDMIGQVRTKEDKIMSAITDAVDKMEAAAAANSNADDAAEAMLITLSQQIADLKLGTSDPATIARIEALADAVNARASHLAAAITAVPPAAPAG